MKKVTLIFTLITLSFTSFAQDEDVKTLSFSGGVEGSYVIGDFKDFYSIGFGASLQGDYLVTPTFAATLGVAYLKYSSKEYEAQIVTGIDVNGNPIYGTTTLKGSELGLLPILVGGKFWFTPMFYGHGQVGITLLNDEGGSNFSYAPGIGVKFSYFDVSAKYFAMSSKGNSNFSAINLRLSYNF